MDTWSGQWSLADGKCGALPSTVKMAPGMLLPLPILASAAASAAVMVPKVAWPSDRGAATSGTVTSWISQPSYHPDSLLMTNRPEMSVNMSMNAPGSFGSVGSPGLGSTTTRTAPSVGRS